jgi:hypothetical protein
LYDTYPKVTRGVALFGNYAYVAIDSPGSLLVIDIMDPTNPKFKDSYNTPSCVYGVAPSKNYVYVADRDSGLHILAQNLDNDSRS